MSLGKFFVLMLIDPVSDVPSMTAALIYRALERNTGSVGLQSNSCTSIQAVNPEIAAVQQHQGKVTGISSAG